MCLEAAYGQNSSNNGPLGNCLAFPCNFIREPTNVSICRSFLFVGWFLRRINLLLSYLRHLYVANSIQEAEKRRKMGKLALQRVDFDSAFLFSVRNLTENGKSQILSVSSQAPPEENFRIMQA